MHLKVIVKLFDHYSFFLCKHLRNLIYLQDRTARPQATNHQYTHKSILVAKESQSITEQLMDQPTDGHSYRVDSD